MKLLALCKGRDKAVNLIFISGRGLAMSSDKQGKSGSIYNFVKNKQVVLTAQTWYNS